MKKTLLTIFALVCINLAEGMEHEPSANTKESTLSAVKKVITEEQVLKAWEEFDVRGDDGDREYQNIIEDRRKYCDKAYSSATSEEEKIGLLEKAICGPESFIVRPFVRQEEQRFIALLDKTERVNHCDLLEACTKENIDLKFISTYAFCGDDVGSYAHTLSRSWGASRIYDLKRAAFWFSVSIARGNLDEAELNRVLINLGKI